MASSSAARADEGGPPPDRPAADFSLVIPSDVREIERVVAEVQRRCQEFSYPQRQCALNLPVALSEALSNAILRGNGDDPRKPVRVHVHVDARALVLEVGDEGDGFDLEACESDPARPENLLRENGRGIFLMRRLMDKVERFQDHGNVVRLTMLRR